jgi:hypothetical protein
MAGAVMMTLAHWFTQHESGGFSVERAARDRSETGSGNRGNASGLKTSPKWII